MAEEADPGSERLWSFPDGMLGPDDSIKDFTQIDKSGRAVFLRLTREDVEELPEHHEPAAPVEWWMVEAIDRANATRSLGGDMY